MTERVRVWVGFANKNGELQDFVVASDAKTAKELTYSLIDYTPPNNEPEWIETRMGQRHYLEFEEWVDESAYIHKCPLMNPEGLFEYE